MKHLVLEGGYPDGALCLPVAFWHVGAANRRCLVPSRLEPIQKRLEVLFQPFLIVLAGLAVDTRGPVLACAAESLSQKLHVDVVGQAQKGPLRRFPRQVCYPLKSRRDRIGNRRSRSLSLQQFRAPVPPFSPRGPSGRFPRFIDTSRALRLPMSLPPHFVAFAQRYRSGVLPSLLQVVGRLTPASLDPCSPVALPACYYREHARKFSEEEHETIILVRTRAKLFSYFGLSQRA